MRRWIGGVVERLFAFVGSLHDDPEAVNTWDLLTRMTQHAVQTNVKCGVPSVQTGCDAHTIAAIVDFYICILDQVCVVQRAVLDS
jgi:hypothetical protein